VARSIVLLQAVLRGDADVGVTSRRPGLGMDLAFLPVASSELVAVVAKEHPLAGQGKISQQRLAACDLIVPDSDSYLRSAMDAAFHSRRLTPRVLVEAGGWDAIRQYVVQGCGVGVMPASDVSSAGGSLASLQIVPALPVYETGLAFRQEALGQPLVREFLTAVCRDLTGRVPALLAEPRGA
jgi:LysR family transcriptional regulator, low CO2-responsive transcriptional regulator